MNNQVRLLPGRGGLRCRYGFSKSYLFLYPTKIIAILAIRIRTIRRTWLVMRVGFGEGGHCNNPTPSAAFQRYASAHSERSNSSNGENKGKPFSGLPFARRKGVIQPETIGSSAIATRPKSRPEHCSGSYQGVVEP